MSQAAIANFTLTEALREAEQRFIAANPESKRRFEKAREVMPGGNTRTVLHYAPFPVTFRAGRGQRLEDVDGHVYTDFLGEYSAGLYGHSHPAILAAAEKAIHDGIVLGGPNEYEAELAALVCRRFPSCELIRFTNSGTEANLMALSTARAVTGRSEILAFDGGYHGGILAFAKGGSPLNAPFPMVLAQYNDLEQTLGLIERHAKTLAAIILEPMMGGGGAIAAEPAFLKALREAATRHDIVLIFDEVMTSRLSPGGLQGLRGITPDMTTFGKYIGGGFSFGAFGGARRLMERFDPSRPDAFAHAGTFNNNVLTMAAGIAGLTKVYTPEAAVKLSATGDRFRERLNAIIARRGVNAQVTGIGSLNSVHFQKTPIRAPRDVDPANDARALLQLEMMARGFYLARRGYMTLSVVLEDADYDGFAASFEQFFETYGGLFKG